MGGDHKCPLCSATFTRPQHVGRHLRAHTGDRPYECKECPLRFARSDLLSRHVNKAHRAPEDGGAPKKEGKKGRRKSTASEMNGEEPRRGSVDQGVLNSPQHGTQLQASKLYPHHPLLSNNAPSRQLPTWNTMENFAQPYPAAMAMQASYPGIPPTYNNLFTATPMRQTGSEQGGLANNYLGRSPQMNPWAGYDFGFKKKACDQCNHSKVRCDFADPCARCSHRNIMCTYNKPSKSRSIVQTMPFGNRLGIFESSSNGSNSSTSPQSQFTSSPLNKSPNTLPISPHQRRQSLSGHAVMPAWNATFPPAPVANPVMSQPMWTQSMSDLNAMVDPNLMAPPIAQPIPVLAQNGIPMDPYARATLQPTASGFNSYNGLMTGSPSVTLAPTPALTNDSRSPSHVSESSERRNSRGSQPVIEPMTNIRPTVVTDNMPMPVTYSPTSARSSMDINSFNPTLTADGTMTWSGPGITFDPRLQFRNTAGTDEDGVSVPGSSRASVYLEPLGEGAMNALSARRFSTGAWASAFNNMTLQDANGNPTSISVNALTDPYTAGQIAQTLSARRPTFPFALQNSDGTTSKIPSMADVKDLWKLFMSEPITGPTPSIEKSDGSAMVTPRPGIGRTLSKRNSMPDLSSPNSHHINNFFAHSGVTPKPTDGQSSYIPPHIPSELPAKPDANIRKWKDEINQRQAAFTMQPGLKLGGKVSSPSDSTMPPPTSMDFASMSGMAALPNNRPLASVLQQNPALYQTLAPERAPSYGLGASYEDGIPTLRINAASPVYAQPSVVTSKFTSNLSGPVITSVSNLGADATDSAMPNLAARPGNKRLASQTLVHEKRASFSLYDEGTAEEGEEVSVLSGAMDPSNLSMWGGVGVGVPVPVQNGH